MNNSDTIAAVATPAGRGGILGKLPPARYATFSDFVDREGKVTQLY